MPHWCTEHSNQGSCGGNGDLSGGK